ncbi:MAG: hypothetical protein KKE11_05065, partial [Gammaproteobacteria bacterium]|nr:hypothetical protein [Gammaproteobacteria bacterium]
LTEKLSEPGKTNTQNFKFVNAGKFAWGTPQVDWKTGTEPKHVTLDANNCNDSLAISPLGSCSFTLTTTKDNPGDWGKLDIKGDNLAPNPFYIDVLCAGLISIIENTDTADLHLGYRSIKVASTVIEGTAKLTTVGTPIAKVDGTDKIKYCAAGDTDCTYQTNCAKNTVLQKYGDANDSCLIWFKSINSGSSTLYKETAGTITVNEITGEGSVKDKDGNYPTDSETEKFTTMADQAVYAGGHFTSPENYIAKWNGEEWSKLGDAPLDALNGIVRALIVRPHTGDLYVGGYFTSPKKYIAKWNGSSWAELPTALSNLDNTVFAFSNGSDKDLYIGGLFTTPGKKVIKCDASDSCTSLPSDPMPSDSNRPVYALAYHPTHQGGTLFIGGNFTLTIPPSASNGVQWSVDNGWDSLNAATFSGAINALALFGTNLYVGGDFQVTPGNFIARYNAASNNWTAMGTDGYIYTILAHGNFAYIGGNYSAPDPLWHFAKFIDATALWAPSASQPSTDTSPIDGLAFATTSLGEDVYLGGSFTAFPGNRIAKWNDATLTWTAVGGASGINNHVRALAITTSLDMTWSCTPGDPEYPCQ